MKKMIKLVGSSVLLAALLVGCSSQSTQSKSSSSKQKTKIAFFTAGDSDSYIHAQNAAAKAEANKLGFDLHFYNGQFNALTQLNQIQNALSTGEYKGFVIAPVDPNVVSKILTVEAPAKGVAVAGINSPLGGSKNWHSGTLTYVGGQEIPAYKTIFKNIFETKADGGTIAVIGGPATGGPYLMMQAALKEELENYPKWKLVGSYSTDYTANKAFQVTENALHANPKLDVLFSNYSGMTVGVAKARDAQNRKDVQIFDFGGDKWAFQAVKSGEIKATAMMLPNEEVTRAIDALYDHFHDKKVAKYINLINDPILPGTFWVTKDNIDKFVAKGLPEY